MWSVWSARLLRVTGRHFHQPQHRFGSAPAWLTARTTVEMEVAINRLTKLRFPQGSEVWISGCPKFGTAEKSGLTNPKLEAETASPEPPQWRAVSGFPRS